MDAPIETGSMSWISLLAASSHLMDERVKCDATADPSDEEFAVANLLCLESTDGVSPNSRVAQAFTTMNDGENESLLNAKKHKCAKPLRYIRGIPAVSKRDIAWNIMFKRLQEFKYATGHCNVPQGFAGDLELATWVKNQRQAYRYMLDKKTDKKPTKRISPDRVTRLNHMGFEWRKYVRADEWKTPAGKRAATRQKHLSKPSCDFQPIETASTTPATPRHKHH